MCWSFRVGYTGTLKCFSGLCTFDTSLCAAPCTCSSDGNACTTDQCVNNVCQHTAISGCCISASQCNDNNICTTDSCSGNNLCSHSTIASCCTSSSQCGSGQTCNNNICVNNQLAKPIKIFIIGDSTAAIVPDLNTNEIGWGAELQQYFDSSYVIIVDNAESGASSKTFLTRASWTSTQNSMSAGDYLLYSLDIMTNPIMTLP